MLLDDETAMNEVVEVVKNSSSVLNRKLYMSSATRFMGKTKADSLFRDMTGASATDSEMIGYINEKEELFEKECKYRNYVYTFTGKITRNNVEGQEFISLTFVSKEAVKMFMKNFHILFVDGCYSSDKGNIFLAVFLDGNHMIQPIGFQICSVENNSNWTLFMKALYEAGIRDNDLVINSDRHQSISNAVSEVFPNAEHTCCFVHVERNIQDKWVKHYGSFSEETHEMTVDFNGLMKALNRARMSTSEEDCEAFLKCIEVIEKKYSESDETPVTDYIRKIDGIFMYKWHYTHLLQVTTNPVEVCMKELKEERYGLKDCRSETVLNKYRYLVRWIYERMEVRYISLKPESRIPVSIESRIPSPYIERFIRSMGHYYECYRGHFDIRDAIQNREITTPRLHNFKVIDRDNGASYIVDMRRRTCTCNYTYWSELPCIHMIGILHERKDFSSVWNYIGDMYLIGEVVKTCRRLTEKERCVIESIVDRNTEEFEVEKPVSSEIVSYRGRKVHNARRIPSTGEMNRNLIVC